MDFSVCIPTRGNLAGLTKTLDSFEKTTTNFDGLEILLGVDKDDPDLEKIVTLANQYSYVIKVYTIERSEDFCRCYYNFLADRSTGENIMMYNDDCWMQTFGWDKIIRFRTEGQSVYMVDLWDSTHEFQGHSAPRFPMISRRALEVMGFFFYPQVRMWPADLILYDLYKAAGCVIKVHEVKMQHDHIIETDPSKGRFWRIYQEDIKNGVFPVDTSKEEKKLKEAMMPCPVPVEGMPKPHKELLLGCGSRTSKDLYLGENKNFWGLVRLDNNADHKPDVVHDLTQHPLPFPDEEFDEIHAYDVLEHLAPQGDYKFFFREFSEYWRILKPGGHMMVSVPSLTSRWAWGDPSHTRVIQPESLVFLQQKEYEAQVGKTKMSDFRYLYKANFEVLYAKDDKETLFFILQKI